MAKKNTTDIRVIEKTIIWQINRQSLDIQNWREAINLAEKRINPRRYKLYDIYSDVLLDGHVTSVIEKRKASILNSKLQFQRNGQPVDDINTQLASPWFLQFLNDFIDTRFFGFSLFQFYRDGNNLNYDLIPRKHVDPHEKILLARQEQPFGEDYTTFQNMLACGDPTDLGLLCKIAGYTIYKRNCMADYAQFAELFGQPIREGTYDGYDDAARKKLLDDLSEMGGSSVIVHPAGTAVQLHEVANSSNSAFMYKTLIDICKSEISTLVLGNTLTTNAGDKGSRALGEVHKEAEDDKTESDRIFVLNTLNYFLSDIFTNLGFNCIGGEFYFVKNENTDLTVRVDIDQKLKLMGLPISDDYLYETYGIPKPDNYEELKLKAAATPPAKPVEPVFKNMLDDDFRFAPDKKKHINAERKNIWRKAVDFFD